jgi:aspartyl/asparaginyl beta-hydroxylase (cupin superfamily)
MALTRPAMLAAAVAAAAGGLLAVVLAVALAAAVAVALGVWLAPYRCIRAWNWVLRHTESPLHQTAGAVAAFPWLREAVDACPAMAAEFEALHAARGALPVASVSATEAALAGTDGLWRMVPLRLYGADVAPVCAACPVTAAFLARHAARVPTAYFSVLRSGKVLQPHRGPFKGVLRCHLGIRVPAAAAAATGRPALPTMDQLAICVDGRCAQWARGELLMFDDTRPHAAWNLVPHAGADPDAAARVVLLMDIVRPLPWGVRHLNALMLAAARRSRTVTGAAEWAARGFDH